MADTSTPDLPRTSAAVAEPTSHDPDARGHFGVFGGRYVPEALMAVIEEVTAAYEKARTDEAFLDKLFQGTNLTYILNNDIYLIGNREMEGLRITKVIQLQYRTVDKIEELIPEPLKQADMTIKVFPELNSIVVSGSALSIKELEAYINQIDKLVPVVNIEIIIMDVNKGRLIETGISAGIGTPPAASQTLFPAVDFRHWA